MNEIKQVPMIISSKDLDYLSDMFTWNYGAYKNTVCATNSVNDVEIKNMLESGIQLFHTNMVKVLDILNNGGSNE